MRLLILFLALFVVSGCTGVRLIVDAVPSGEHLTETVVMQDAGANSKIAQIDLTGLISDAERPGLLQPGENPVSRFVESLEKAQRDRNVKAVVIRINSPGGTVTASDVIYRAIMRFKQESGKPVVVCMADVAASGGYYVACAGDEIIAMPTTVTGSIGVIIQTINVHDGLKRIGVRAEAITSGPNKAVGSPFEPMSPEHRELLQNLVNEFYGSFTQIVTTSRPHLKSDQLAMITDGRIISGKQAAEFGLVDRVGDLHDAFDAAKRRANLNSAKMVKYHRQLEYVGSAYATTPAALPQAHAGTASPSAATQINLVQMNLTANPLGETAAFYYLWDPSAW